MEIMWKPLSCSPGQLKFVEYISATSKTKSDTNESHNTVLFKFSIGSKCIYVCRKQNGGRIKLGLKTADLSCLQTSVADIFVAGIKMLEGGQPGSAQKPIWSTSVEVSRVMAAYICFE